MKDKGWLDKFYDFFGGSDDNNPSNPSNTDFFKPKEKPLPAFFNENPIESYEVTYKDLANKYQEFKKNNPNADENQLAKLNFKNGGYEYNFGTFIQVENEKYIEKVGDHSKIVKDSLGWKIHIAIGQNDENNVALGTDIVMDILRHHNVSIFKIAVPGTKLDNQFVTGGKQITIYYELDKDKDWQKILNDIEQKLKEAGIQPSGEKGIANKLIGNSDYLTRRNDNKNGVYVHAFDAGEFNPSGKTDPFAKFIFSEPEVSLKPK